MGNVLDIFNHTTMLNYLRNVEYPALELEALFPSRKQPSLKFTQIQGAGKTPIAATVHAFDTEAEIGSRQAEARDLELVLIKRKMQLNEEQIIALQQPRSQVEKEYMINEVFNDVDVLVQGVLSRIEAMRGEVLATGKLEIDENNYKLNLDYNVPEEHQEALSGDDLWTNPASDPFEDMMEWVERLGTNPTRIITSRKVLNTILRHPATKEAVGREGIITRTELNQFMDDLGLPIIGTYDETYLVQNPDGTYETKRYFPEDRLVMMGDNTLGETIYGPTAEEIRLTRDQAVDITMKDHVLAMMYEETRDPVGTWTKAVATAIPSFPGANEVFQAKVIESN